MTKYEATRMIDLLLLIENLVNKKSAVALMSLLADFV